MSKKKRDNSKKKYEKEHPSEGDHQKQQQHNEEVDEYSHIMSEHKYNEDNWSLESNEDEE